jgi:hypothetical protein
MPERKRISRNVHDALENDTGLDLQRVGEAPASPTAPVAPERAASHVEAIERVPPTKMMPDRFQPRPVLPVELHERFHAGKIDCYQAAAEWLKLAESDLGHRTRVRELTGMAETFDEHGQIKPITGVWIQDAGGAFRFRIETGERRFWGACLKRVAEKRADEPLLRVEAIPKPSLARQIIENRHAQPPSAVAQAREIAALILQHTGIEPDAGLTDPYDFFRQAINLPNRDRLPHGVWPKIEELMQLTPRRMQQILSLLRFPTPLLEKADRYSLPARVLEAILTAEEGQWADLIEGAAAQGGTADDVAVAAAGGGPQQSGARPKTAGPADPSRSALRGLRGFSNALYGLNTRARDRVLGELADEIFVSGDAKTVAPLLDELSRLVRARIRGAR